MFYDELKTFIIEYGKTNGSLLQSNLIKSILDETDEYKSQLPDEFQNMDKHKLSILTYNILIDSLKDNKENNISKNNLHLLIKKLLKEKLSKQEMRRIVLYLLTGSMLIGNGIQIHKLKEQRNTYFKEVVVENRDCLNTNPDFDKPSKSVL